MKDLCLFESKHGCVSKSKLYRTLLDVGAQDCDVLYIHSDMTFGLPAKGVRRRDLLDALFGVINDLGVKTVIFPTFTFSFCNDEPYDIQNSRTFMGSLNEHVRKNITGVRSKDPLLSVFLVGEEKDLIRDLSPYSIGQGSNYDKIHNSGLETKFLFFGADMRECFTYTHFMESLVGVPYRYNRKFLGTIIDNGIKFDNQEVFLYSTYANCKLNPVPVVYNEMLKRNQIKSLPVGNSSITCIAEKDAFGTISDLLRNDIYSLTDGSFDPNKKDDTYSREGRILSVK